MINYDSPIIQIMYILGIDLTNVSEMNSTSDYFAFCAVCIFGLYILYLIFKYLYKDCSSIARGL